MAALKGPLIWMVFAVVTKLDANTREVVAFENCTVFDVVFPRSVTCCKVGMELAESVMFESNPPSPKNMEAAITFVRML